MPCSACAMRRARIWPGNPSLKMYTAVAWIWALTRPTKPSGPWRVRTDDVKQLVRQTYCWLMVPTEEMVAGKLQLRWEAAALSAAAPSLVEAIEIQAARGRVADFRLVTRPLKPDAEPVVLQGRGSRGIGPEGVARQLPVLVPAAPLNAEVFVNTVAAGCATRDGFAYAAAKDAGRWQGFAFGRSALVTLDAIVCSSTKQAHCTPAAIGCRTTGQSCGRG